MRKVLLITIAVPVLALAGAQFIRPELNLTTNPQPDAIGRAYTVPGPVADILKRACLDCHSNNTYYPWYSNIQPLGWWLRDHISDGKDELNFDEFASYSPKKQFRKSEEVWEEVEKDAMPLPSYTWVHRDAVLTAAEKDQLKQWVAGLKKEISEKTGYSK